MLVEMYNGTAALRNSLTIPLNVTHGKLTLANYLIVMKSYVHTKTSYMNIHGSIFIKAKKWKQPKFLSTDEKMNIMLYIHMMECYLATKRNEILKHATIWMKLKNITLSVMSEVSHKRLYTI